jgi:hypothetical protein
MPRPHIHKFKFEKTERGLRRFCKCGFSVLEVARGSSRPITKGWSFRKLKKTYAMVKKGLHRIKYDFTKSEIDEKSKQLADACGQKTNLIAEKKSVVSDFKAKIDAQDSIIGLLSGHITNGYEYKSVECEVEYDFGNNVKRFFFQGILYDTEQLTDADRQLEIDNR